jgi:predicted acylesterase/phospholipase RssA
MSDIEDTQYCDLVMKGGITSGVVYPTLVSELASRYRFKNIGGTSAGAIAAGACAAAEYGRGHANPDAFETLRQLPVELGEATSPSGRSKLFSLFQPSKELREHFGVFVGALNAEKADAARRVMTGALKMHRGLVVGGLLAVGLLLLPFVQAFAPGMRIEVAGGMALFVPLLVALTAIGITRVASRGVLPCLVLGAGAVGVLMALLQFVQDGEWSLRLAGVAMAMEVIALLGLILFVGIIVARFVTTLLRGLHHNDYGICSGRTMDSAPDAPPGLADWLTRYFDGLAGLPEQRHPLTFGDLWGTDDPSAPRQINLEVMTSAISQQMVYGIPFRQGSPRFHYDPDEWAKLFPPAVMTWLETLTSKPDDGHENKHLPGRARVTSASGKLLRPLPHPADLPVVVAVRMSLSFPILLSAVPLYSVDWSRKENQEQKQSMEEAEKKGISQTATFMAKRVWFSDGGIGSNMPLHMFDALLPRHPTFAVNLKGEHPDYPIQTPERPDNEGGRVYLPDDNTGGRIRYWTEPGDTTPLGGLVAFLLSIVDTMQNWRDEILFPFPGFRDRIVQVSQRATEGGLNLDMPEASIKALGDAGRMAASRLIDRFHPTGAEQGKGWLNHQTVRLGTFLGTMQPGSVALQASLASGPWAACVSNNEQYRDEERQLSLDFLSGLQKLGALGADTGLSLEQGALKPLAQIRISPRI